VAAGAAAAPRVVALPSAITLTSQTSWVRPGTGFSLGVSIQSDLPPGELYLRLQVFSRLASRYALDHPLGSASPSSTISHIAIGGLAPDEASYGSAAPIDFRVATRYSPPSGPRSGPLITLDCADGTCDGVYPLEVQLVNAYADATVASFVTDLIYVSNASRPIRLGVGLVVPLGASTSLDPNGHSTLTAAATSALAGVVQAISLHQNEPVTLALYPELLWALREEKNRSGPTALAANKAYTSLAALLRRGTVDGHVELLDSPFAPADPTELVAGLGVAGATRELDRQLATAADSLTDLVGVHAPDGVYVSPYPLSAAALTLVTATGACEVVVPGTNLAMNDGGLTPDAPLVVDDAASHCHQPGYATGPTVLTSDAGLALHFREAASQPQLAAHLLLAELAQTYFENPYPTEARGVVVAPASWSANSLFLSTVLSGLSASPVLDPLTVADLFATVPLGANGQPSTATLLTPAPNGSLDASALTKAERTLATVASVVPHDTGLVAGLQQQILVAESAQNSPHQATQHLAAVDRALSTIGASLTLFGSAHVTLTSRTGKIPITIQLTGSLRPVDVVLRVKSSNLDFPASEVAEHVTLTSRDTQLFLTVSARTSGESTFTVELVTPTGATVLLAPTIYNVTSTAVSGVAIALSLAALAVLAMWWIRSVVRHRRAAHTRDGGPGAPQPSPA
jgi:hypothetical protein